MAETIDTSISETSRYIQLLADADMLIDCLEYYNLMGTRYLTAEDAAHYCEIQGLI